MEINWTPTLDDLPEAPLFVSLIVKVEETGGQVDEPINGDEQYDCWATFPPIKLCCRKIKDLSEMRHDRSVEMRSSRVRLSKADWTAARWRVMSDD